MRNNTLLFRTIFGGSPFGLDILTKIQTKIDKQLFFHRRGKIADNYIKEQKLRHFFSPCIWNWRGSYFGNYQPFLALKC